MGMGLAALLLLAADLRATEDEMDSGLISAFKEAAEAGRLPALLERHATFNIEFPTLGGHHYWQSHRAGGWNLQVNTVSGWWRILDDDDVRVARGTTEEQLRNLLEDRPTSLLANYMDRTLLRNEAAFELARKTSLDWTPSGEFVELYLNGAHQGNYWLGEQIRVESNRLQADYLIEMDTYYDETNKFYSTYGFKPNTWDNGLPIGVKYPDDDDLTSAQFQEIKDLVAGVENAIYNGGDYNSKINLDSFLDWYLVHEVTYNGEPNHPKSCYFHFNKGVMIAGPVWDFDWYTYQPNAKGFFIPDSIYFKQLFGDPAVKARLKERWAELQPKFLEVDTFIAEKAEVIRKSNVFNYKMWPSNVNVNGDDSMSYDNAIVRMRNALTSRISELDKLIKAL